MIRNLKSTIPTLPTNPSYLHKSKIPLFMTFTLGEETDFIESEIINCRKCKGYINPYVEVIPPGLKWRCNLCYNVNSMNVPFQSEQSFSEEKNFNLSVDNNYFGSQVKNESEYRIGSGRSDVFDPLKNYKVNCEIYSNSMLRNEMIDLKASSNYVLKKPVEPNFVFMIEATYNMASRGVLETCFNSIMNSISLLNPNSKICIIFFNSAAYILKKDLKFEICADFSAMPRFDENKVFFSQNEILNFFGDILNLVRTNFYCTKNIQNDFGGSLLVSETILEGGGIICTFLGSIINCGVGELCGTSEDLKSKNEFYKKMAISLPSKKISINFFLFPQVNIEIPSILILSRYTGGENHYFPNFNSKDTIHSVQVKNRISKFLSSKIETEGTCRIWCDKSAKVTCFYGNFQMNKYYMLNLTQSTPNHNISIELEVEQDYDKFLCNSKKYKKTAICFQIAHLRNVNGTKRIKILNFCLPMKTMNLIELYESLNLDSFSRYLALKAANELIKNNECTNYIHKQTVEFLYNFKNLLQAKANRFPQFLEFVRKMNYLQKCVPLRPKNTPNDYKSYYFYLLSTHPNNLVSLIIQPQLFAIHDNCKSVPLSLKYLEIDGFYVLDTGVNMFFFIACNSNVDPALYFSNSQTGRVMIIDGDLKNFVSERVSDRSLDPVLFLVVDNCKSTLRDVFFSYFYEDSVFGLMSLEDYVRKVENEV
ncbi:Protein transport protein sec24 [Dictyocoela muelleri]|nr:Protein transport protein sec24 [Dictyocoela muelleri]